MCQEGNDGENHNFASSYDFIALVCIPEHEMAPNIGRKQAPRMLKGKDNLLRKTKNE